MTSSTDPSSLAADVAKLLLDRRRTIATAESCTGGLLAKMLTDIPGSSGYFLCGWITYSNRAKRELLGVPQELIETHGAVSESVAREMAGRARTIACSDFALAITGIAGPTGGTPDKPVGTVWIAMAGPPQPENEDSGSHISDLKSGISNPTSHLFNFSGDRETIRRRAVEGALLMFHSHLVGSDNGAWLS